MPIKDLLSIKQYKRAVLVLLVLAAAAASASLLVSCAPGLSVPTVSGTYISDSTPATTITLGELPAELSAGHMIQCSVDIVSSGTDLDVRWSSSDDSVASVEYGVITAHSAGSADITVCDALSGASDTVTVTVRDYSVNETKAAVRNVADSYTDAQCVSLLKEQREILSRCTSDKAKAAAKALDGLFALANQEGYRKTDDLAAFFGIDKERLLLTAQIIWAWEQLSNKTI